MCPAELTDPLVPAILMTDYTYLAPTNPTCAAAASTSHSTVCIELKPKWGFLPGLVWAEPWAAAAPHHALKRSVCRFCMHQHTKHSSQSVAKRSAFCPLHLFSGQRTRVRQALRALLDAPQNNLTLFCVDRHSKPAPKPKPTPQPSAASASPSAAAAGGSPPPFARTLSSVSTNIHHCLKALFGGSVHTSHIHTRTSDTCLVLCCDV